MITAIIQARVRSSRLPRKVLLLLGRKTILENVVERVKNAKYIKKVIVATSDEKSDDEIAQLCKKKKFHCFRGSLNDVLDRYYQAAKKFKIKHICRITADCPLIDPKILDIAAKKYLKGRFDYVSTAYPIATYPDGLDTEIFSFEALEKSWKEAKLSSEREHVTPYIWKNPKLFKVYNIKNDKNLSSFRWTVDEEKDLKFVKEIYKRLDGAGRIFYMKDILALLRKNPELIKINKGIVRNEGYLRSLKADKQNGRSNNH
jgi:spore coat polysaccharide biosynthesis protein SpsF